MGSSIEAQIAGKYLQGRFEVSMLDMPLYEEMLGEGVVRYVLRCYGREDRLYPKISDDVGLVVCA